MAVDKPKRKFRFHSEAHKAKMHQLVVDKIITLEDFDRMAKNTPKRDKLPDRIRRGKG